MHERRIVLWLIYENCENFKHDITKLKIACAEHGIANTKIFTHYVFRSCDLKNFLPQNFSHALLCS